MRIRATINGEARECDVKGSESLLFVLRENLDLPGSKGACEQGECGSCSVLLDGALVCSCLVMAVDSEGSEIVTVEGLGGPELHPVQRALVDAGAVQCGFCTPGFVMACQSFLENNPNPSQADVEAGLSGNICRCGTYVGVRLAALEAAEEVKGGRRRGY